MSCETGLHGLPLCPFGLLDQIYSEQFMRRELQMTQGSFAPAGGLLAG